jgi:hypothetical protein
MKAIALCIIIAILMAVCFSQQADINDLVETHHRYVRETELRQAELEARLKTLERIGIEIELKQRDGIWLVTDMKGK